MTQRVVRTDRFHVALGGSRPPRTWWRSGLGLWVFGAALFALLTVWASAHSLFPGEQELAKWLQGHQYPKTLGYEEFADLVGARITLYVLTGFGLLLFVTLQRWQLAALVLAAPLLTIAGHLLKIIIRRPRPAISEVIDIREPTTGFSFPSGHSLQAAIIGVVAIILVQQLFTGKFRRFLQLGAVWLTATVGWERVFDGVHWPTDVVGGFLLGTLLVTATWQGLIRASQRLEQRRASPRA